MPPTGQANIPTTALLRAITADRFDYSAGPSPKICMLMQAREFKLKSKCRCAGCGGCRRHAGPLSGFRTIPHNGYDLCTSCVQADGHVHACWHANRPKGVAQRALKAFPPRLWVNARNNVHVGHRRQALPTVKVGCQTCSPGLPPPRAARATCSAEHGTVSY